jgi:acetyl esterase/lipase
MNDEGNAEISARPTKGHRWLPTGIPGWGLTIIALLLAILFLTTAYYEINLVDFKGKGILGVYGFLFASQMIVVTIVAAFLGLWALDKGNLMAASLFVLIVILTAWMSIVPTMSAYARARKYGVPVRIGEVMVPLINGRYTERDKTVTYHTTADGLKLELDVWEPNKSANGRRPAILKVHGGGWTAGARSEHYQWNLLFNDLGYVVFDMDYRLPKSVDPAKWIWTDEIGDVKCALRWIVDNADRYDVDINRIGLFGYSAGANLVTMAAYTKGHPRFPATCRSSDDVDLQFVIGICTPSELTSMYKKTGSSFAQRCLETYLQGSPAEVPDRYEMASPVDHVGPNIPPTILFHGETDRVVPFEQIGIMEQALKRAGATYEYYKLPYADHGYDFNWNTFQVQTTRHKVKTFIAKHNP